jgi:hypothetical protein
MDQVTAEMAALDYRAFAFVMTLTAVVNGLGIVRWLTDFAEYLRQKDTLVVKDYWVFLLAAGFQFLLHILLWWTLWNIRESGSLNFLTYLYLLTGPVLLYLGTTLLSPRFDEIGVSLREHLLRVRRPYSTILCLMWIWTIFASPIFRGFFAPTLPLLLLFLVAALAQRLSARASVIIAATLLNWLTFLAFVGLYAINLGVIGTQ